MNQRIDPTLKRRFHIWSIENNTTMTDAVSHWITLAVDGKLKGPPKPKSRGK